MSMTEQSAALPYGSLLNGIYQTGEVLGVGGFGITYAAKNINTGYLCCIKEYVPDELVYGRNANGSLRISAEGVREFALGKERFLDEARILGQLRNNVSVVNIHDFFEQNETAYFAMEYLAGLNMRAFQQQNTHNRRALLDRALQMLLSAGSALMEVHRFGMIHGDISPENIMLTKDEEIKLIDFGAARNYTKKNVAQGGKIFLKSGYAPPEQYSSSGRIGPWTDLYSLAATYYAIITGQKVQDAKSRMHQDFYRPLGELCPDIDKRLATIIDTALSVDYRERYQSMKEFLEALAQTIPEPETTVLKELVHEPADVTVQRPETEVLHKTPQKKEPKRGFWSFLGKKEAEREARKDTRVYLEMHTRGGAVRSWILPKDLTVTIGRHPSCQIVLPPDDRLSRRHCTLRYINEKGVVQITDESTFGTYRDHGIRMIKGKAQIVLMGEAFYMAVPEFRFRVVED